MQIKHANMDLAYVIMLRLLCHDIYRGSPIAELTQDWIKGMCNHNSAFDIIDGNNLTTMYSKMLVAIFLSMTSSV